MKRPYALGDLKSDVMGLAHRLQHGCGNHGCRINAPRGMGTNSICQCTPLKVSRVLLELAEQAEKMGHEWPRNDETPQA